MKENLKGVVPSWQRERDRIIAHICRRMEKRNERGQSLDAAARLYSRHWHGRPYRTDPHRPLQLSSKTILRHFRAWRKAGRTPAAFALHYKSPNKFEPGHVFEFAQLCAAPGVRSLTAAYAQLTSPAGTASGLRMAMPGRLRIRLTKLCAARRTVENLERAVSKGIAALEAAGS
jgi:hypothetical protein